MSSFANTTVRLVFPLCSGRVLCHYVLMSGLQSSSLRVPALWPHPELKPHTVHPLHSWHVTSHAINLYASQSQSWIIPSFGHSTCIVTAQRAKVLSCRGGTYCYGKKCLMTYNTAPFFGTTWTSMAGGNWDNSLGLCPVLSSAANCAEFYSVCKMQWSGNQPDLTEFHVMTTDP